MNEVTAAPGRAKLDARDPRLPVHARLAELIRARVESGEWSPTRALPAETVLAGYYGVALGTMRRVLGELVEQGVLERSHGRGTFVRRARLDTSLFRFFRYGEAEQTPPKGQILDVRRGAPPAAIAAALGIAAQADGLQLSRVRLHGERAVLAEEIWLPLPRFAGLEHTAPAEFGDLLYPLYERRCGIVIASAEEVLTVGSATAEDEALLPCARGEPLVIIERIARTHDATAVEWRRSRGRAADFRYRIEIR